MFGKIFRFVKRQAKTKTGKAALGIITTTLADTASRSVFGVGVADIPVAGPVIEMMIGPVQAEAATGFMFLRDKQAKKDNPTLK